MDNFKKAFLAAVTFTVFCGFIYTMAMTGICQALFPDAVNGKIIEANGVKYSELLGQQYTSDRHMWGRITKLDVSTYKDRDGRQLAYAAPSNLSPASEEYEKLVAERVERIRKANPEKADEPIPVDLVTNSGSGLDPDISAAAARYQADRLARANNMSKEEINAIIDKCTNHKVFGFFGEETVNVLKVNLMIDKII